MRRHVRDLYHWTLEPGRTSEPERPAATREERERIAPEVYEERLRQGARPDCKDEEDNAPRSRSRESALLAIVQEMRRQRESSTESWRLWTPPESDEAKAMKARSRYDNLEKTASPLQELHVSWLEALPELNAAGVYKSQKDLLYDYLHKIGSFLRDELSRPPGMLMFVSGRFYIQLA
ncbi:hypothetical protein AK812_SmicGene36642 [Symbiodinium microadriaticum]|uniref:Uncharacterized protein n=1 Tax=Symbiodinium microadriaticum TaxID=2951 RepID=A0A1Q9CIC4_SYMMI|nr:hypothetical protein AK812_SmicGene36642 [Symbiodinium microadriaticum]